jgi:hypothetical protein
LVGTGFAGVGPWTVMKRERVEALAKAVAAFVKFEMKDAPDDFVGQVAVTVNVFKSGMTGIAAARNRTYDKEAIAAIVAAAQML